MADLGVATFDYAPYAIFNLACPLIAIGFGYLAFKQSPQRHNPHELDHEAPFILRFTVEAEHIDALEHTNNTQYVTW